MARNWHAAPLATAFLMALLAATSECEARGGDHFRRAPLEGDFRTRLPERRIDRDRAPHRGNAGDAADEPRGGSHGAAGVRRELVSRNQFWANQFGARDFHCRNDCTWGWVGPVFWPFALGDIFAYAWWPYAGPPAFWDYGLNVILTGLFWPNGAYQWPDGYGAYAWSDDGSSYRYAREAHQNVYSGGPSNEAPPTASEDTTDLAQTCSGLAPGVGALPMDRIEQAVRPDKSQRAAFDQLDAASAKAEAILKGACPSEPPLTLVGRLDALQQRLKAMDEAVDTLMAPLGDVSRSLNDEQRRALEALGGDQVRNADPLQMSDIGGCVDEGQQFTDVPLQQIEQSVQPDARQKTALDRLKTVSIEAAQKLRLSCPTSVAATPEARLEAMDKRLHDTIIAVNEVRPALVEFYDSISDEQKARFDTLPPEQAAK